MKKTRKKQFGSEIRERIAQLKRENPNFGRIKLRKIVSQEFEVQFSDQLVRCVLQENGLQPNWQQTKERRRYVRRRIFQLKSRNPFQMNLSIVEKIRSEGYKASPALVCTVLKQTNQEVRRMEENLYHYRALVVEVMDGDTCKLDIDLGLRIRKKETVRLFGVGAPELREEGGETARNFLQNQIEGKQVMIDTKLDREGKYGRLLATVWVMSEEGEWVNVNELVIREGFAVSYYR